MNRHRPKWHQPAYRTTVCEVAALVFVETLNMNASIMRTLLRTRQGPTGELVLESWRNRFWGLRIRGDWLGLSRTLWRHENRYGTRRLGLHNTVAYRGSRSWGFVVSLQKVPSCIIVGSLLYLLDLLPLLFSQ